jgi:hypothetical protein
MADAGGAAAGAGDAAPAGAGAPGPLAAVPPGFPGGARPPGPPTIQIPMEVVKKWPVIYPVYINAGVPVSRGRKVPLDKCAGCEFVSPPPARKGDAGVAHHPV